MSKMNKRGTAWSRSVRVVGAYLVAGVLWILLSDTLVEQLVSDPAALTRLQSWKGWGFVFVTAGVLHLVLLQQFRRDRKQLDRNRAQQEEILRLS
ncbi:MAG: sensor domain-containing diguanylate cyclase, partial [Marinobacter sp.]